MNSILMWPLSETQALLWKAPKATLSTITCCDSICLVFVRDQKDQILAEALSGCQVSKLKKELQQLLAGQITRNNCILPLVFERKDKAGFTVTGFDQQAMIFESEFSQEHLVGWIGQIDLLEVLMHENELEQKSRGQGCC